MTLDKVVGIGARATVYRDGKYAIKLFDKGHDKTAVFYEVLVNSIIEKTGLPIPIVYEVINVNNQLGIKMDYIDGISFVDYILQGNGNLKEHIEKMVKLQIEIHSKNTTTLPFSLKDKLKYKIQGNESLEQHLKEKLLERLKQLPNGNELCHGDLHGYNILVHQGEYWVIDWIDSSYGCAEGDVCRVYLIYSYFAPEIAELYLTTYCNETGKERNKILEWLPVVAAARLCEDVPKEREWLMDKIICFC